MLEHKVVLVTGGTGAIGSAICHAAAENGAWVAFTYKSKDDKAISLVAELETLGARCRSFKVRACDRTGINAAVKEIEEEWEQIDVLINNLGATQVLPFALIEEEDWDQTIAVNLKSMFLFTQAVVRGMIRRRAGVILNMGSIAGHRILEVPVHYATAKAGVSGFTTALAKEFCRYGIRVNEVVPGLVDGGVGTNVSGRQLEDYKRFCSLGRPGTTEEVAQLVVFLSSDRASYINGQSVIIDGGL